MASYIQSINTVMGSSYFQGLIMPWDEYICISISDTTSLLVVGTFDGISDGLLSFSDTTVYTLTRQYSQSYSYHTSIVNEDNTLVSVSEPYYCYSNTLSGAPVLNCTSSGSVQAYFVIFCCLVFVINQFFGSVFKSVVRRIFP